MNETITIALISLGGAIIGSGGITAIINHILAHKGKTAQQLDRIESDLKELDSKVDRNEAQRARTQILRFGDEILYQPETRHTKEHFDEILDACDKYNKYCDTHPEFENMRTMETQEVIREIYQECIRDRKFLNQKGGKR